MNISDEVKSKILKIITPRESETKEINEIIESLIIKLKNEADLLGLNYMRIEPQGSTGIKQTNLAGTADIDIFVFLNPEDFPQLLEKSKKEKKDFLHGLFKEYAQTWFTKACESINCKNVILSYAEHPYLSATYGNYSIDIIGCFDVTLEFLKEHGPITAVDRTPHHSNFINSNLNLEDKKEVRLLKTFFKSGKIYGDKSRVDKMGFTGFSCELLIYFYKTIENVFINILKSNEVYLDFFKRNEATMRKKERFHNQPIILIDPTDPDRNVTASINEKIFKYSKFLIDRFQSNPNLDFFLDKNIIILKKKIITPHMENVVFIEFDNIEDKVHYTLIRDKLYVIGERIKRKFNDPEYNDIKDFFYSIFYNDQNSSILYYFKNGRCFEKEYLKKGPPINLKKSIEEFKDKNKTIIEKDGRIWAPLKRKYHTGTDLINSMLKDEVYKYFILKHVDKEPHLKISEENLSFTIGNIFPFYFPN